MNIQKMAQKILGCPNKANQVILLGCAMPLMIEHVDKEEGMLAPRQIDPAMSFTLVLNQYSRTFTYHKRNSINNF